MIVIFSFLLIFFAVGCDNGHTSTVCGNGVPAKVEISDNTSSVHDDDGERLSVDGLTTSWYLDRDRLVLSDISFTVNKVHVIKSLAI